MKFTRRYFLLCGLGLAVAAHAAPDIKQPATTSVVKTWRGEWNDASRKRDVPVKIYYPEGKGKWPVILFSHGLGGSRDAYTYLGNYWAAHGYIAVHLQHIGGDTAVWMQGDRQALVRAANLQNAVARANDVKFVLDQLELVNTQNAFPLRGQLDLAHVGLAGHSFGANTTLLVSGMKMMGTAFNLADPRIKASIAMSSPAPVSRNTKEIYGSIKLPMYHMTGTEDTSPIDKNTTVADRRLPFDNITGADQYLVTFDGGTHMLFSGRSPLGRTPPPTDERNHALIQQSSTAFWDAYLKNDAGAKKWLQQDFTTTLGRAGTWEMKK